MELREPPDCSVYEVHLLYTNKNYLPFSGTSQQASLPFSGKCFIRRVFYSWSGGLKHSVLIWNVGGLCIFICRFWKGVKLTTPFQHQPINAVQADVVFNPAPVIPSMCRILSTLELGQEYFCVCFLKCQWLFCSYSSLLAVQTHLLKIKVSQRL